MTRTLMTVLWTKAESIVFTASVLGVIIVLTSFDTNAKAVPQFFTNKVAFQSATSGIVLQTETFDSTPGPDPLTNTAPFATVSKNITLSHTGTSTFGVRVPAFQGGSGNAAGWVNSGFGPLTFTFPSPINALGVDIWDLGDFGVTSLTLTTSTGSQVLFNNFSGPDNNLQFGGVLDTTASFISATFTNTSTADYIEFDDLTFGNVPEPAAFTIALLGIMMLSFHDWRRIRTLSPG